MRLNFTLQSIAASFLQFEEFVELQKVNGLDLLAQPNNCPSNGKCQQKKCAND